MANNVASGISIVNIRKVLLLIRLDHKIRVFNIAKVSPLIRITQAFGSK